MARGDQGKYTHVQRIMLVLNKEDATGEEKLWAAVLLRAILDLSHKPTYSCTNRKSYKCGTCHTCQSKSSAKWWVFESHDMQDVSSFPSVCDTIGVDPVYMRQAIKEIML
jgi:hypothetical protein